MNYGLYLSASGVLTNVYRQDVFANNLANVETVGFKRDLPAVHQRDPEAIEDNLGIDVRKRLLDRLGGGVLAGPQRISFEPGALHQTGNPMDVALESPNAFLAVNTPDAQTGQTQIGLTRDGRFSRDAQGYLVTIAGGHRLLDPDDQPIQIQDTSSLTIDQTGQIIQSGEVVGRLQITGVRDINRLVKQGENLYRFEGAQDQRTAVQNPTVRSGFVEASTVEPIRALTKMIEATKAATANANMIRYHDLLMDRAVNVLGRVA